MKVLKDIVDFSLNTSLHGLMFRLKPSRIENNENLYDYNFEVGNLIEFEDNLFEIVDKSLSTSNLIGGPSWYVKVIEVKEN